jgi:hypothetical protein
LPEWMAHTPFREGAAPEIPPLAGYTIADMPSELQIEASPTREVGDESR